MSDTYQITGLDVTIARSVLDNDVWQDEDGLWWEREYMPLADGYTSTVRLLPAYSQVATAALDLRETIALRTGIALKAPFYEAAAVCQEALALNGVARYRPTEALQALIAASQWEIISEWDGCVAEALVLSRFQERWPQVYIISNLEDALYVGQTAQGVTARLNGHLRAGTLIGAYLREMKTYDDARIQIVTIKSYGFNSLNAAEQHYIDTYQPRYNQQRVIP